ncbi:MAG: hypothetical protein EBT83_12400 [Betaproteobacteria bacterium]|nr:hypothetical protein [Betaproteobacteria bacterium]
MAKQARSRNFKALFAAHWRAGWLFIGLLSALPLVPLANQELLQVRFDLDTRLIVEQRLWESDPAYRGTAENWARFAAWLLDSEQLLERARELRPAIADAIEADYRRDLAFALGGVIGIYLAMWGLPFSVLYLFGMLAEARLTRGSG